MIRNLIFDMGGVLIHWGPAAIVARLGLNEQDNALVFREVFCCAEWPCMDHGRMTREEAFRRISKRLPETLHEAARRCVFDWWKEPLDPIVGMKDLIRELKELGYGLYVLSNATEHLHEYFPRIPGSEYFDGMLVSADEKVLKPSHEFYEKLCSTFGLKSCECFFIDDSSLNVDGAWAVGMQGTVFFDDMARLRAELREAGIPVRAEP